MADATAAGIHGTAANLKTRSSPKPQQGNSRACSAIVDSSFNKDY